MKKLRPVFRVIRRFPVTSKSLSQPSPAAVCVALSACFSLFSPEYVKAAAKASAGSGNWNTAGTWSPSGAPAAGDTVTIAAGHTVTVDTNTNAIASMTVNGTLTIGTNNTDRTVTVTGGVTIASAGTIQPNPATRLK